MKIALIAPYPAVALISPSELKQKYRVEHPAPWVRCLAIALATQPSTNVRVLSDSRAVYRRHEIFADGVIFTFLPKKEPIRSDPFHGYIPGARRIRRELIHYPPDIVVGFGIESGCARLAVRQPYPSIVFVQGIIEETAPYRDIHPLRLKAYLKDERQILFDADGFVAETDFARKWIFRHNPKAHVAVIPHPVDTTFFSNKPTFDRPLVLCIGSLNLIKDPITILQAFSKLSHPGAEIVFVGDGPLMKDLQRLVAAINNDRVTLAGFLPREQLLSLMRHARILVLGSRMDTSPNVVTEAHAAGLPVIASRTGGIPEMIEDGTDGFLVNAGDIDGFAEKMEFLLQHPLICEQMGRLGREKVRLLNDPDTIAVKHLEFYKEVLREIASQKLRTSSWLTKHKRNRFVRTVTSLVPPGILLGKGYRHWKKVAQTEQNLSRQAIDQWQLERFRTIMRYASQYTEGYRELYKKAGISADDIREYRDVQHVPFVTKELLRDNLEAFSVRVEGRKYTTTGGSTGIPLGFYYYKDLVSIEWAFMHASWEWIGWRLGMRSAVFRGGFVGSKDRPFEFDPLKRELLLSSYFLNPSTLPRYLEAIARYKTRVLQAYPSSLNLLCDLLCESTDLKPPQFDIILLGSENIYEWQLEKFEKIFPRARLYAWYGQAEQVTLALWCEHSRLYHSRPFYGLTEVIDEAGNPVADGGEGEIVGTNFHNLVTPFIRYKTMDYAVRRGIGCPYCKRPFLILEKILGRAHEFIVTGTGRYLSMTAINMHDDIFDGIRQFRFRQERPGHVIFQYIPAAPLGIERLARIRSGLLAKLGEDMELELREVSEIPRSRSGKLHFLDQQLPIKYHQKV